MTLFMRDEEKRAEGRTEERIDTIQRLIKANQSKEFILSLGYSEEEYAQATQTK